MHVKLGLSPSLPSPQAVSCGRATFELALLHVVEASSGVLCVSMMGELPRRVDWSRSGVNDSFNYFCLADFGALDVGQLLTWLAS